LILTQLFQQQLVPAEDLAEDQEVLMDLIVPLALSPQQVVEQVEEKVPEMDLQEDLVVALQTHLHNRVVQVFQDKETQEQVDLVVAVKTLQDQDQMEEQVILHLFQVAQ
jgi:outer membrane PBP1 activator LpoA protein